MSSQPAHDGQDEIIEEIERAIADEQHLNVCGGGTKSFLGSAPAPDAIDLNVAGHCGVLQYEPGELVLRARCGTPLKEIEKLLAEHGQMLPFEPPHFGESATLGGAIACGLSGPRRPYCGAVRDAVLGIDSINGSGEVLSFGGQVMKNVAGYDVSRLMAGSMGTLGVILDVSLKVDPMPETNLTVARECSGEDAIGSMRGLARSQHPVSATYYDGQFLHIRLSGNERALAASAEDLPGDVVADGDTLWEQLREQTLPWFQSRPHLWRIGIAPADLYDEKWSPVVEWGGAQRWLVVDEDLDVRQGTCAENITLFRATGESERSHPDMDTFQPLTRELFLMHQAIKNSLDPRRILNRGRVYRNL